MRRDNDLSAELTTRLQRNRATGVVVLIALAAWALWPGGTAESMSTVAAQSPEPRAPSDVRWVAPKLLSNAQSIDVKAFDAQLWKVPPKPIEVAVEPPPPPPSPPPPLKLQLVGILANATNSGSSLESEKNQPSELRAALFDPDANKIYTVAVGASVLRYRVKSISSDLVELVDAQLPNLPPYALKMKSNEFKLPVVTRGTRSATKSQQPPSSITPSGAEPVNEELASGGGR
ncbi:MAG: hypothetical protein KF691_03455 [Phycisphaeraceae bacterium]|nr:hypothetical protein [Phycisphaeraceae bacterium]